MRVETLRCFDQPDARNLQKVLIVLAAMREPASQRFRQPQMGVTTSSRIRLRSWSPGLGLDEEVLRTFGEFFARDLEAETMLAPEIAMSATPFVMHYGRGALGLLM